MKRKFAGSLIIVAFLLSACVMSASASTIMPRGGNECPNCGLDGYPQESTAWDSTPITTEYSTCGHGGAYGYNDVTRRYAGVHVSSCPHCGYGSQSIIYRTETYCYYLQCTF
jgi:hypothetical protein